MSCLMWLEPRLWAMGYGNSHAFSAQGGTIQTNGSGGFVKLFKQIINNY